MEKPFLLCAYNQVGDHDYVSPQTNRVYTVKDSSDSATGPATAVLSASPHPHTSNQNQSQQHHQDHDGKRQQERDILVFQQATNEVWNVYAQLYYGGEGVGSVFFKRPATTIAASSGSEQLSFAMEGIFGIHKSTTTTASPGGTWDSVHVVHIDPPNVKEWTCQYRIQSAVVLSMRPKSPNPTNNMLETTTTVSSMLQKETIKVLKLQHSPSSSKTTMMSSHLEHLGKLIEEVEIGFRSKLERIDIPQSLDILESMYDPQQQEVWNSSSRNVDGQGVESSTADGEISRQWNSTTTRTTGMSRIGAAMMEDITSEALRKKTKGNVFLDRMKAQQEAKEAQLAADHQDHQDTIALVLSTTKSHLKSTTANSNNNVPTTPVSSPLTAGKAALRRTIPGGVGLSPNPAATMSPTPEFLNFRNKLKKTGV